MQKTQLFILDDLYPEHLSTIRDITFTRREVDVMSCLLGGRKTSKIAYLLSINSRTVETYIQNITLKLECNTREGVIDFLELSDHMLFLRRHYLHLQIEHAFRKGLTDLSKLIRTESSINVRISGEKEAFKSPLMLLLKTHLKLAGVRIVNERGVEDGHLIYLLSQHWQEGSLALQQIKNQYPKDKILLMSEQDKKELAKELKGFGIINIKKQQNYYFYFFDVIKIIFPKIKIDLILSNFKEKYEKIDHVRNAEYSSQTLTQPHHENPPSLENVKGIIFSRPSIISLTLLIISFISIGFYWRLTDDTQRQPLALSELPLPTKSVFLERPELLKEIDKSFSKEGDIKTVALVGIGGSGKTTLARQYAHKQHTNVVWEMNAETSEGLYGSFENLAHTLAKAEEDKKVLTELLGAKNSSAKKENLINFVKEHLKLHSPWFLIFDNVENFSDIQKYFPQNINSWGRGKIILTTRNINIQNNKHIEDTVLVGELSPDQKLNFFMQIMNHGEKRVITGTQPKAVEEFLEQIPPFPLDISVAAYYLNSTNISYAKYLENIKHYTKETEDLQGAILKETGEYIKTRYAIITHSLEHVIKEDKNFVDLLLLISLIDSQNIPKSLLDDYKNSDIVDTFIYYLKKYSLVESKNLPSNSEPMYSIHRSTQMISLAYLIRLLNLNKNSFALNKIAYLFDDYIDFNILSKEEFFRITTLLRHLNAFLQNEELFDCNTRCIIKGNIGILFSYLSEEIKSQQYLKESLSLITNQKENYARIARYSGYLGVSYLHLGDYKNAKSFLEQSVKIYEEYVDEKQQDLPWVLVSLGNLHKCMEDYKNAEKYMNKAVDIAKKKYLDDETLMAWILGHLASIHSSLGNNIQAKALFEQCLAIYEKNHGLNHPKRAWLFIGLGIAFRNLADFTKAKEFIEKGIEIQKTCYSESSLKIALGKLELAQVYLLEGQLDRAEILLQQSFEGFKSNQFKDIYIPLEIFGDLYLKKEIHVANIGKTENAQEFNIQAKKYFNQALENIKPRFPINSPPLIRIQAKLNKLRKI
ncbi:MAG: tetratricopeptide repeat protein [Alphaproteobacteria bacterium]|nr:tetratricopeptide repeat protein [Alphaproteobacteria bacterium]